MVTKSLSVNELEALKKVIGAIPKNFAALLVAFDGRKVGTGLGSRIDYGGPVRVDEEVGVLSAGLAIVLGECPYRSRPGPRDEPVEAGGLGSADLVRNERGRELAVGGHVRSELVRAVDRVAHRREPAARDSAVRENL